MSASPIAGWSRPDLELQPVIFHGHEKAFEGMVACARAGSTMEALT
jgi:hypothetical protein